MNNNNLRVQFENDLAVSVAYHIKEEIEAREISEKEFAEKINIPEKKVHKFFNGEIELDEELLNGIEKFIGVPKETWLKVEKRFRELRDKKRKSSLKSILKNLEKELNEKSLDEFYLSFQNGIKDFYKISGLTTK